MTTLIRTIKELISIAEESKCTCLMEGNADYFQGKIDAFKSILNLLEIASPRPSLSLKCSKCSGALELQQTKERRTVPLCPKCDCKHTDPSVCPECGRDVFSDLVDGVTVWRPCKCGQ